MNEQMHFDFSCGEVNEEDLFDLPLDCNEEGYIQNTKNREVAVKELEKKFGVILNQQVRLRLIGWEDQEFKGKLVLNDLLISSSRKEGLRLRLGRMTFDYTDIAFCATLE